MAEHVFTSTPEGEALIKRAATPEEMSGLFNEVIPLLKHLLATRHYTNELTIDEATKMYQIYSQYTQHFIDEYIIESPDDAVASRVSKAEVYDTYKLFCARLGKAFLLWKPVPFGRKILATYPSIRTGKTAQSKNCYIGLALSEKVKTLKFEDTDII